MRRDRTNQAAISIRPVTASRRLALSLPRHPFGTPLDLAHGPLARLVRLVPYPRGAVIAEQDAPCGKLHLLARGRVLLSRHNEAAGSRALYLLGPGSLFGVGAVTGKGRWLVTARAVTASAVYLLPAERLPEFAVYYPQLAAQVITELARRVERGHRRLEVQAHHSAKERLLGLLEILADYEGEDHGGEVWLDLPVSQAVLGEMVGLARETVARALGDLESDGTIRREGRKGLWLRRE